MNHLRAAAHVHSDWSYDGQWSLPKIAAAFGRLGCDAVLMAEHDRGFDARRFSAYRKACSRASTRETVLIPGIEYSDPENSVHIPVWGDVPFLGEGIETEDLLDQATRKGGLAVLAHLGRRDVGKTLNPTWLPHLAGVELWNRKYDGYAPNGYAARLLHVQPELVPFVSLDFHTARQFHPLTMVFDTDRRGGETAVYEAMVARRVEAKAFGLPAVALADDRVWPALRRVEQGRRRLAQVVR